MNAHTSYTLIAILAVVGTVSLMPSVVAQNSGLQSGDQMLPPACPDCVGDSRELASIDVMNTVPITVRTDSAAYNHDSTITVQGQVASVKGQGVPVTLTVTSPSNNIVTIKQLNVDNTGSFETSLSTAGSLWKYDGTYTIRVQYGAQETNNKVLVELTGGEILKPSSPVSQVSCSNTEIRAVDQCIPYSITGGTVISGDINDRENSIVIMLDATDDGELTLNPSTTTIRGIFLVLVDGEESDDVEIDGNMVTVMFPAGTEKIEVIGTFVVPEFGTIAALILAVAIISIIAVTARSRLSVMPKF